MCTVCSECLFRYDAASKAFSSLVQLLTDGKCYFSEKCIIPVPSFVSIYLDCIAAHIEAALCDEAVMLCDALLSKCSSSLLSYNADTFLQSHHDKIVSQTFLESMAANRKRNRSVLSTNGDGVSSHCITVQVALYKSEALLELGRADDALLCVDRLVFVCYLCFCIVSTITVTCDD